MQRKVSELLKEKGAEVYTIGENGRLKDVVKIFNAKHIGALMVINEQGEIQGIITERDILKKLARTEGEVKEIGVRLIMTPKDQLKVGTPDDTLEHLMEMMTIHRFRHVPIVESESTLKLCGMISIRDIVKTILTDLNLQNKYLENLVY
ncbi:MAG: CBS domain-containing protein [Candidatus Omnitrophota bacterium]